MKRERWAGIQEDEFEYHAAKDATRILERNLPYWRSLLEALPDEVRFDRETRVLEIGCGGCGILLALDEGRLVGVDPLMDRYLVKFPFLAEREEISWVNSTGEELEIEGPFDVVFLVNTLDHVWDPRRVARRIEGLLRPGGHCVMTLNCHKTRFFRFYFARFHRVIDRHHPHQFTPDDARQIFDGFTPIRIHPIDDLWLPHAEAYEREVLRKRRSSRRKRLETALNPFQWPIGLCDLLLDMPRHPERQGQRSIYSNYLFVLRRQDSGQNTRCA